MLPEENNFQVMYQYLMHTYGYDCYSLSVHMIYGLPIKKPSGNSSSQITNNHQIHNKLEW